MASPLGWFRRHQKGMMVVFGMVLMAIFGLGSVAMLINNPSQVADPSANKVMVTWDGGKLKKSDLDSLRVRHFQSGRFVSRLTAAANRARDGQFRSVALPIRWMSEDTPVRDADEQVAQTYILAERAKREGIVISDTMVNDYITLLHNLVDFTEADLQVFNREANGEYSDIVDIRSYLKIELAAQQYTLLLRAGLPSALSPTEAADYNSRMEKTIECTVLGLNVDDYVNKVDEKPTNSELKKIFEEGRYKLIDPAGIEPGFKQPKRIRVNYVAADFNDFLTAEKLKITDKQVQDEYARLVKEEDPLVMELVPPVVPENPDDNEAPKPEDNDAPAPNDDDAAPAPPGDDDASEENKDGDEEKTDESKSDSGEKTEEKDDDKKEENGDDGLSLNASQSHFVSLQEDEKSEENAKQEKQESEKSEQENTESQKADQGSDENQTEEKQSDENKQADEQNESDDPKMLDEQEGENDQESDGNLLPGEDDQQQTPILTRPKELDADLSDLIRERMVSEPAFRQMREMITEAQDAVREQQYAYAEWDSQTDAEKRNSEAPTLDLKELADRLRLQYGETDLLNYVEMKENEGFGARKAIVEAFTQFGPRRSTSDFADLVFDSIDRKTVYEPGDPLIEMTTQANILWWPVEIKDVDILEFDEAKDQVIEVWKRQKAYELALADAERIAGDLNSSGEKLIDYSKSAENTGNFTWYLNGMVRPKGVESPGEDFMDTAFALSMNECGAALNGPKDFAYVIQKTFEDTRTESDISSNLLETWSKFQMVPPNVMGPAQTENRTIATQAFGNYLKEMNVQWVGE